MIRTVILAALVLACLSSVAEARHYRAQPGNQVGCADPVMRPCGPTVRKFRRVQGTDRTQKIRIRWENPTFKKYSAKPRAWCGWYLSRYLGKNDRRLWRALAWRHVGRAAHGPAIGVVVIWSRGKGRGHVGIITGRTERGWVILSGNDGNAVRERVRSVAGAVAFRWP